MCDITSHDVILGCDFLRQHGALLDFVSMELSLRILGDQMVSQYAPAENTEDYVDENFLNLIDTDALYNDEIKIYPDENITLKPKSRYRIKITSAPIKLNTRGMLIPKPSLQDRLGIKIASKEIGPDTGRYSVYNFTENFVELTMSTALGTFKSFYDMNNDITCSTSKNSITVENSPNKTKTKSCKPLNYPLTNSKLSPTDKLEFDICKDIPEAQQQQLRELLLEFQDIFAFSVYDIKETNFVTATLIPK